MTNPTPLHVIRVALAAEPGDRKSYIQWAAWLAELVGRTGQAEELIGGLLSYIDAQHEFLNRRGLPPLAWDGDDCVERARRVLGGESDG